MDRKMTRAGMGMGAARAAQAVVAGGRALLAAGAFAVVAAAPVAGETVTHDLGGSLDDRFVQLAEMQARNEAVRITGICYSACTLYLGLANVCVTPEARLGFHGPSAAMRGLPLPAAEFERQTNRMAEFYPPILRDWFMTEARYMRDNVYLLTGQQLISAGVKAC